MNPQIGLNFFWSLLCIECAQFRSDIVHAVEEGSASVRDRRVWGANFMSDTWALPDFFIIFVLDKMYVTCWQCAWRIKVSHTRGKVETWKKRVSSLRQHLFYLRIRQVLFCLLLLLLYIFIGSQVVILLNEFVATYNTDGSHL